MAVAPANSGPRTPTVYIVHLDDGTKIVLNTGEITFPDTRQGILRGQPLLALRKLVEFQGNPVSEMIFHECHQIADVRNVIGRLREIIGDTEKPHYYIIANIRLGYYLTHYRLEIVELPPLDLSGL